MLVSSLLAVWLGGCTNGVPNQTASIAGDTGIGGTGFSDEGIGGTGIGTVTGFGSIIINRTHEFDVGPNTILRIDGQQVDEQTFKLNGLGLVVSYQVRNANADFTRGTLVTLDARHQVRGPITSIQPLKVLDQEAVIRKDAVLVDGSGLTLTPDNLTVGEVVEISGFSDNNKLLVTRLQVDDEGQEWKLTGKVSQVTASAFNIGAQKILLNGKLPKDCGTGMKDGDLVEATFQGVNNFQPGATIDTLLQVACKSSGLQKPENIGKPIHGEIEGVVTRKLSATELIVNGQPVLLTNATLFEGGTATQLVPGTLVEVKGKLHPDGKLQAEKVEIKTEDGSSDNSANSSDSGTSDNGSSTDGATDGGSTDNGTSTDGASDNGATDNGSTNDGATDNGESKSENADSNGQNDEADKKD